MKDVKTYTIGLLECDHVRPEFLSIAGDYRDMFPNLFHDVAPHYQFRFYDVVNGSFPEKASDCDAYLSTGSSFSVYENVPWIHQLADFVRTLADQRSEEHTSELQSRENLVCRLLLEKKK